MTTLPPNDTVNAWKKLFMVAKCLWSRTRGGRRNEGKRKTCILRKRIQMWNEDKIDILWSNFKSQVEEYRRKSRTKSRLLKKNENLKKGKSNGKNLGIKDMKKINEQKINDDIKKKSKKIERLVRNNDVSKATNYMISNGIFEMDKSIRKQLLEKHPGERERTIDQNEQYTPQFKFNMEHLELALKKIKSTKSAG